jgi:hypothetical protein
MGAIHVASANRGVDVSWATVPNAAQYKIIWSTDGTPPNPSNDSNAYISTNSYSIINVTPGLLVRVGVKAIDYAGQVSGNIAEGSAIATGTVAESNEKIRDIYVNTAYALGANRILVGKLFFNTAAYITKLALSIEGSNFQGKASPPAAGKVRIYSSDNPKEFRALTFYEDDVAPVGSIGLQLSPSSFVTIDALDSETVPHITYSGLLSIYYEEGTFQGGGLDA